MYSSRGSESGDSARVALLRICRFVATSAKTFRFRADSVGFVRTTLDIHPPSSDCKRFRLIRSSIAGAGLALPVFQGSDGTGGDLFSRGSFVAGTDFEPDGRAFKAEGGADLILEKTLERKVQFDGAVGEEDEGWRRDGSLSHVVNADAFGHGNAGALEIDFVEEAIHLAGGDALAALGGDAEDHVENAGDIAAFGGGDEEDWSVAEVFEDRAELALEDGAVCGRFAVGSAGGHEVPLVDDDDDAAAALVRVAADGGVGGGDAFGGVDDEEGDVSGFKVAARHDDGELLGHEVRFAFAADAGGIDDAEVVAFVVD